jgi:hypothetical protein
MIVDEERIRCADAERLEASSKNGGGGLAHAELARGDDDVEVRRESAGRPKPRHHGDGVVREKSGAAASIAKARRDVPRLLAKLEPRSEVLLDECADERG